MTKQSLIPAPELKVSQWFNSQEKISLEKLRGKVIIIEAFQMLCPGCIQHGLPLAQRIREHFRVEDVAVLGLHTVFEHHNAMTPVSLEAFIFEYRLSFPIGVDEAGNGPLPKTMEAYRLRGTPSLLVIDQEGYLRSNHFGHVSDMQIASEITQLLCQKHFPKTENPNNETVQSCDENGCEVSA